MKRRKSKLNSGFLFQIKDQFRKKLRFFEPANASKRIITGLSKSVEKAYLDISNTQERFNAEREKIREGLSESVRYNYDPLLFFENKPLFKNMIREFIAPEIYKQNKAKIMNRPSSETRIYRKKFENVDEMIEQCKAIKENNTVFRKNLPKVGKNVRSSYEIVKKLTIKPEAAKLNKMVTSLNNFYN